MPLAWSDATPVDRDALREFVCADPAMARYHPYRRQKFHPRPWELRVQSAIHELAGRVPVARPERLIVGRIADGRAAAVSCFGLDRTRTTYMVWLLACATWARGTGSGREALGKTLAEMHAAGDADHVFARIDPRNGPSVNLFRSNGFQVLREHEGFAEWVRRI